MCMPQASASSDETDHGEEKSPARADDANYPESNDRYTWKHVVAFETRFGIVHLPPEIALNPRLFAQFERAEKAA